MKTLKAAIIGDFQIPFHDDHAIDVAQQIVAAFAPDILDYNGDILDLMRMSKFPGIVTEKNEYRQADLQTELHIGIRKIWDFTKEVKPKQVYYKSGNHEQRMERVIATAKPSEQSIFALRGVRDAVKLDKLLELDLLGVPYKFAKWPNGLWLHPTLPPDQNVWVEHGNSTGAKAGYSVSNVSERRASSVIMGHVHRLSLGWKHLNSDRDRFMIEGGHLSILGTPGEGDDMYFGSPFSVADYLDYQQGFSLVTFADGKVWPELVRIKNGSALWNGKLYKSRIKRRKAA